MGTVLPVKQKATVQKGSLVNDSENLDRICVNCNYSFPTDKGDIEEIICLNDPDFEPYVDRLLEDEDFACCTELIQQKRFPQDQEACEEFSPVEFDDIEISSELSADIKKLADAGDLTQENLEAALTAEFIRKTDWSKVSVNSCVNRLNNARTIREHEEAIDNIGWLILQSNREAFDALCAYLRSLPPPKTPDDCGLRVRVLHQLSLQPEFKAETAQVIVDDLLRTKSNNHTRSWFTAAWGFFERCSNEIRQEALQRMLDSPKFSYRIKRVVRNIIDLGTRYG